MTAMQKPHKGSCQWPVTNAQSKAVPAKEGMLTARQKRGHNARMQQQQLEPYLAQRKQALPMDRRLPTMLQRFRGCKRHVVTAKGMVVTVNARSAGSHGTGVMMVMQNEHWATRTWRECRC